MPSPYRPPPHSPSSCSPPSPQSFPTPPHLILASGKNQNATDPVPHRNPSASRPPHTPPAKPSAVNGSRCGEPQSSPYAPHPPSPSLATLSPSRRSIAPSRGPSPRPLPSPSPPLSLSPHPTQSNPYPPPVHPSPHKKVSAINKPAPSLPLHPLPPTPPLQTSLPSPPHSFRTP